MAELLNGAWNEKNVCQKMIPPWLYVFSNTINGITRNQWKDFIEIKTQAWFVPLLRSSCSLSLMWSLNKLIGPLNLQWCVQFGHAHFLPLESIEWVVFSIGQSAILCASWNQHYEEPCYCINHRKSFTKIKCKPETKVRKGKIYSWQFFQWVKIITFHCYYLPLLHSIGLKQKFLFRCVGIKPLIRHVKRRNSMKTFYDMVSKHAFNVHSYVSG